MLDSIQLLYLNKCFVILFADISLKQMSNNTREYSLIAEGLGDALKRVPWEEEIKEEHYKHGKTLYCKSWGFLYTTIFVNFGRTPHAY